jgi:hypothetical protein
LNNINGKIDAGIDKLNDKEGDTKLAVRYLLIRRGNTQGLDYLFKKVRRFSQLSVDFHLQALLVASLLFSIYLDKKSEKVIWIINRLHFGFLLTLYDCDSFVRHHLLSIANFFTARICHVKSKEESVREWNTVPSDFVEFLRERIPSNKLPEQWEPDDEDLE